MSGVEIIGLAASVIQLAEVGLKLSLKLYTFTRKIKSADKDIDALSHEIAATGAVLQELGSTLNEAQSAKVCSLKAIITAENLVNDCKGVFDKLAGMIDTHNPKSSANKLRLKQRFSFTLVESQVQVARANLERLKSSLLVILNVLIYAEQLRSHQALPILQDQQQLLKSLVDEKVTNEKRYTDLTKMLQGKESFKTEVTPPPYHSFAVVPSKKSQPESTQKSSSTNPTVQPFAKSINNHSMLVTDLLDKVASNPYQVSYKHKMELHHGILDVHWNSWSELRKKHGHDALAELVAGFADVTQHWAEQAELTPSQPAEQENAANDLLEQHGASVNTRSRAEEGHYDDQLVAELEAAQLESKDTPKSLPHAHSWKWPDVSSTQPSKGKPQSTSIFPSDADILQEIPPFDNSSAAWSAPEAWGVRRDSVASKPLSLQQSKIGLSKSNLSPSPSQETLRPSHPSHNFFVDDDDESHSTIEPIDATTPEFQLHSSRSTHFYFAKRESSPSKTPYQSDSDESTLEEAVQELKRSIADSSNSETGTSSADKTTGSVSEVAQNSSDRGLRMLPRSRAKCWTCRIRQAKCDQTRPVCGQCSRLGHTCDYNPRLSFRDDLPQTTERIPGVALGSSSDGLSAGDVAAAPAKSSSVLENIEDQIPPPKGNQAAGTRPMRVQYGVQYRNLFKKEMTSEDKPPQPPKSAEPSEEVEPGSKGVAPTPDSSSRLDEDQRAVIQCDGEIYQLLFEYSTISEVELFDLLRTDENGVGLGFWDEIHVDHEPSKLDERENVLVPEAQDLAIESGEDLVRVHHDAERLEGAWC